MSELILLEFDGNIAILTLNRPERHNSIIPELLAEMLAALEEIRTHPAVRVIILQANGHSFSTGGDVRAIYEHRQDLSMYAHDTVGLLNRVILTMVGLPMPIVAAVHGMVSGGSLGFVLASDIALFAPEASITPYYAVVGFSPDGGWTAMLPDIIGQRRVAEILMLNRTITPEQAAEWGIATRIVPAEAIRQQARATAEEIVRMKAGSVFRAKRLLRGDPDALAARLKAERQRFVEQIVSPEALHGMEAFLHIGANGGSRVEKGTNGHSPIDEP